MKILVTGANGLLGQKLIELLEKDDTIQLIATAARPAAIPIHKGEFYLLDITDSAAVDQIIDKLKPDVIINTAAMTQVDQCEVQREACWKTNVLAVESLVNACRRNKVHFIHVSTDFIFDGTKELLDENAIPNPVNFYGESKFAGEKVVMESDISWTILRTVLVFGVTNDMSRSNIVLWVKKSLEDGKTIQVVNDQWRTPTLAEDLAMGCYLAAKKKAKGIFNISGKDYLSPYDIAIRTADFFKLDKSLIKESDSIKFTQPARRPAKTGFIIDKARKELGYEPHSFEEGLQILASQLKSVA
ncbi:SDR family oxidoreductase [Chryseolinea sp. H1M3-3]|uniref:SDR family oxidoreductase n=1 Tax=Chryseolinea sp. H1M3-3 TaxID=3034144 RepID=UPI0023EB68F5|nr:SDR family oxidoreductase [Chryseolinea sp. H1M3-3]